MAESTQPPGGAPRRHGNEFEDNHFHDDDEVAPLPEDDQGPSKPAPTPARPGGKLPPPKRRFTDD